MSDSFMRASVPSTDARQGGVNGDGHANGGRLSRTNLPALEPPPMNHGSIGKRIAKLAQMKVEATLKKPPNDVSAGAHDGVMAAVDDAIDPADSELLERIIGHVKELEAIPWQNQTTGVKYLNGEGK